MRISQNPSKESSIWKQVEFGAFVNVDRLASVWSRRVLGRSVGLHSIFIHKELPCSENRVGSLLKIIEIQ